MSVITLAGTVWKLNETLTFSDNNTYNIRFSYVNGISGQIATMFTYSTDLSELYYETSDTSEIAYSNGNWISEQFRTIRIIDGQSAENATLISWFESNAIQLPSSIGGKIISESILPETLHSFEYYKNKLPLWLQQTYGFLEHFKIWHNLLTGLETDLEGTIPDKTYYVYAGVNESITIEDFPFDTYVGEPKLYSNIRSDSLTISYSPFTITCSNVGNGAITLTDGLTTIAIRLIVGEPLRYTGVIPSSDCLLYLLNLYDEDYLNTINNLETTEHTTSDSQCDMLDKIAKLFGLTRHVKVTYDNEGVPTTEYLDLNNKELLMLLKAQIIKNNWNGTFETLKSFYNDIGLNCHIYTASAIDDTEPTAYCKMVLVNRHFSPYSSNILKMFKAGLLRTESLGIMYDDTIVDSGIFGIWDEGIWGLDENNARWFE